MQIFDWMDEACTLNSNNLMSDAIGKFAKLVSICTIGKCLKDCNYFVKRINSTPERRNRTNTISNERCICHQFQDSGRSTCGSNYLFKDEVRCFISTLACIWKSTIDNCANTTACKGRNSDFMVFAAMNENGVSLKEIYIGPIRE